AWRIDQRRITRKDSRVDGVFDDGDVERLIGDAVAISRTVGGGEQCEEEATGWPPPRHSDAALVRAWSIGRRHGYVEQAQIDAQLGPVVNRVADHERSPDSMPGHAEDHVAFALERPLCLELGVRLADQRRARRGGVPLEERPYLGDRGQRSRRRKLSEIELSFGQR